MDALDVELAPIDGSIVTGSHHLLAVTGILLALREPPETSAAVS